ncbi:MAG: threonine/serine dehydratase [Proteobacteria bacterium]|nr:threonine/serine dehydratase [Pseudomonadota bacterium]
MNNEIPSEECLHGAVKVAIERVSGDIHRTPVLTSHFFDEQTRASIFFKCENFQRIGAFKIRGATNAVKALCETQIPSRVITHSSGNHGQAVALAAKSQGILATVVMPYNTSKIKIDAVRSYGADVVFCEPGTSAREQKVLDNIQQTGAVLIHPYDDLLIIAGQGTAAWELLEEYPDLDIVIVPVGGGGLLSGSCLAIRERGSLAAVIGAEPEAANDAAQSLKSGHIVSVSTPQTIADGLRANCIGSRNFAIIKKDVSQILEVSEDEIIRAMRLVWERMKIVIEPSSAVPVAALFKHQELFFGKRVGVIISGGNVDLESLSWI